MRFTNGFLHLILITGAWSPLGAQGSNHVSQGSRIRVTAPNLAARPMVGWVDAVGPTTMTLVIRGDSVAIVPLTAVDRLEISVKRWNRSTRVKRAAGVGALIGFVPGLLIGLAAADDCSGAFCMKELTIFMSAALGSLAGIGVGAVVGGLQPTDHWEAAGLAGVNSVPVVTSDQGRRR